MIYLNSSAIRAVDYDYSSRIMTIQFTNDGVYAFHGVPESVFHDLVNAASPGSYYNRHVRGQYH